MADMPASPRLSDYLGAAGGNQLWARELMDRAVADQARQAAAPAPGKEYAPTGQGNFLTAGLGSGYHGALSQLGSFGEALARTAGWQGGADASSRFAEGQRQQAATYARPDLEGEGPNAAPWYSPTRIGYTVAQAVPSALGVIGGAGLATLAAPEAAVGALGATGVGALAAAGLSYPLSVGGNVQRAEAYNREQGGGPLTQGQAAGSLALGVPEAALGAIPAERFLGAFGAGIEGKIGERVARGAFGQAVAQAPVAAAQEALTGLMGDPNRTMAQRADDIMKAALSGGIQGAAFGGALGAVRPAKPTDGLAKAPADKVSTDDLNQATAAVLEPQKAAPAPAPETPPPAPPPNPDEALNNAWVTQAREQGAFDQGPAIERAIPGNEADRLAGAWEAEAAARPFADLSKETLLAQAQALQANGKNPERLGGLMDEIRLRTAEAAAVAPETFPGDEAPVAPAPAETPAPAAEEFKAPWELPKQDAKVNADTLRAFVMKKGGFRPDSSAELKPIFDKATFRYLKKNGMTLDDMRRAAAEAGYLGDDREAAMANTTVAHFLDALREPNRYSALDQNEVNRATDAAKANAHADALKTAADEISTHLQEVGLPAPAKRMLARVAEHLVAGDHWPADSYEGKIANALEAAAHSLEAEHADNGAGGSAFGDLAEGSQNASAKGVGAGAVGQLPLRIEVPGANGGTPRKAPSAVERQVIANAKRLNTLRAMANSDDPAARRIAASALESLGENVAKTSPFEDLKNLHIQASTSADMNGFLRKNAEAFQKAIDNARKDSTASEKGPYIDALQATLDYAKESVPLTEAGPEGTRQGLIPGIEPVTDKDRLALAANQPLRGGNAPMDTGLFGAPAEPELFRRSAAASRTPLDQDVNTRVSAGASAQDIFSHIAANHPDKDMAAVADALRKSGVNPTVKWMDRVSGAELPAGIKPEEVNGIYNKSQNRIGLLAGDNSAQTILHEGIHAATAKAIDANTSAALELKKIYATLKARSPNNDAYGLTNPHEFVAEAMTNPDFRDFLKGETSASGNAFKDMWQGFKNAVFKALRMPERARNAFDQVMEHMPGLMDENRTANAPITGETELPSVARRSDDAVSEAFAAAKNAHENFVNQGGFLGKASEAWSKFRGASLIGMTRDQIAYNANNLGFKSVAQKFGVDRVREGRNTTQSKIGQAAANAMDALDRKQGKKFDDLTQATYYDKNGLIPFEAHTWLDPANRAKDYAEWQKAKAAADELNKTPEGRRAIESAIAAQRSQIRTAQLTALDQMVANRPVFNELVGQDPAFATNFHDALAANPQAHDSPTLANQMAGEALSAKLNAIDKMLVPFREWAAFNRPPPGPAFKKQWEAYARAKDQFTDLDNFVKGIRESEAKLDQVPNFPAYRQGEYAVAGKFNVGQDGSIPQQHVDALLGGLKKLGIDDVVINSSNDNPNIFIKLKSQYQAQKVGELFRSLQGKALDAETPVFNGKAEDAVGRYAGMTQAVAHKAVALMRGNMPDPPEGSTPQEKAQWETAWRAAQDDMINQFMSMLPEQSLTKLKAYRKLVQGSDADMIGATKTRLNNMARGIANLSTAGDTADALTAMRKELEAFKKSDAPIDQKDFAHDLVRETAMREAQRQVAQPTPTVDFIRSLTHVGQIGLSVPYTLMVQAQIFTLSHPELGKVFGFAKAAKALMDAVPEALEVTKLVGKGQGWKTFQVRDQDLAGSRRLSEDAKRFILAVDGLGGLNEAGFTHANTESSSLPAWLQRSIEYGSVMSTYAEQFPRVLTALAAYKLGKEAPNKIPKGMSLEQYATYANRESQQAYGAGDTARAFGTNGPFGAGGKLMSQFMSFPVQLMQKLYREAADAMSEARPGESAKDAELRRSQSRKWLGAHAAATAMLAGSLGLPGPSTAAAVFDKLADWATGEDSWDVQSKYREWLAHTFGPQVGEVIARGVPRALGFDFSKAGEAELPDRLMPFMSLITDKRKLEDRWDDFFKHLSGSAAGMAMRNISGLRDMTNGDYLKGAIKVLPPLFRNPLEAYQMAQLGGYPNAKGQLDPNLNPGAGTIAAAALGIQGAGEAESREVQKAAQGLEDMRKYRAQNILQHQIIAQQRGDQAGAQYWADQANAYAAEHPGLRSPTMSLGEALAHQMRSQQIAAATHLPMGVNPRDIGLAQSLGWANLAGR